MKVDEPPGIVRLAERDQDLLYLAEQDTVQLGKLERPLPRCCSQLLPMRQFRRGRQLSQQAVESPDHAV